MIKVLNSPTIMTWASFLSRSLGLLLVTPILVTKFSSAEIALWYLFSSAIIFQGLAYTGFGSTFVRMIAFGFAGASLDDLNTGDAIHNDNTPNWNTIEKVMQSMIYLFIRLVGVLLLLSLIASFFLIEPIAVTGNIFHNWIAWAVIIFVSVLFLFGNIYTVFLEGINEIALVRKWDAIFGLIGVISNFLTIYFTESLLFLVISAQFWFLIAVPRNRLLCISIHNGIFGKFSLKPFKDKKVWNATWDSSWKSFLGTSMSLGSAQLSNFLIAQNTSSELLASYLFGYNLLNQINSFSRAPFYSKLPFLASLRKKGNMDLFKNVVKKSTALTYWSFLFFSLGDRKSVV